MLYRLIEFYVSDLLRTASLLARSEHWNISKSGAYLRCGGSGDPLWSVVSTSLVKNTVELSVGRRHVKIMVGY